MKITVKYIPNQLSNEGRKQKMFLPAGERKSARTWIKRSGFPVKDMRVIINGARVDQKRLSRTYLKPYDEVIITPEVKDPGTIGAVFATVATWMGASVTVAAGAYAVGFTLAVVGWVAAIGYSIYSAFQRPRLPGFGTIAADGSLDDNSPSAAWNGARMTQDYGLTIPVIYGRVRASGQVLCQYVSTDGDKSYFNILIGIGQGPIEGLSSYRLNKNPIENFDGISTVFREGASDDAVIPGFEDIHNEYPVNANLTKDNAYTYTTDKDDVEAFVITLNFPSGLYQIDTTTGGYQPWSITYKVEYKLHSAGEWTDLGSTTISGKTRTVMRRTYRKDGLTAGQYDIRVTRTSDDGGEYTIGDLVWLLVDEIQTDDLIYPYLAKVGIKALATDQLQGDRPEVDFLIEGRKVNVPDVRTSGDEAVDWEDYYWDDESEVYRLFSDDSELVWDGETYVDKFCANPVWCARDLLTNNRYGLGDIFASANIPLSEYLTMSRICELKISDGAGGYEKKYRLDIHIGSQGKAADVLTQLAAIFDAFYFHLEDTARFKIDQDEDPVQIFGMGNTYAKNLEMSWKSRQEKYHIVDVQFINQDKDYESDFVSVVEQDKLAAAISNGEPIRRYALRVHSCGASYAYRAGRRFLKIAWNINRIFAFKAGIDSITVAPGDVAAFCHDTPQIGFSGRVKSGSTSLSIKLDQTVTLESGVTYKILVQFSDDDRIEEATVTNAPGQTDTITINAGEELTAAPAAYDKYALGPSGTHYKKIRVAAYEIDPELDVKIIGAEVSANIYDDTAPILSDSNYSLLSRDTQLVTDLKLTEMLMKAADGTIVNAIEVWFRKPVDTTWMVNKYSHARVFLSEDDGLSWKHVGDTRSEYLLIKEGIIDLAEYKVAVVSVSRNGFETGISSSPQDTITIVGKTALPSDVTGFVVRQSRDRLYMTWTSMSDVDLSGYEIRYGTSWEAGTLLATQIKQNYLYSFLIKLGADQSFWIKAIDTSGNYSETAAEALVTIENIPFTNIIEEYSEQTAWGGTKSNTEVSGDNLIISSGYLTGTYTGPVRDVGYVATFKIGIEAIATVANTDTFQDFGSQTFADMPATARFSGEEVPGALSFEIKTSDDNITWSDWGTWVPGDYTCRYFQLRMTMTRTSLSQALECSQFNYYADLPDVDDFGEAEVTVAANGIEVVFNKEFHEIPSVNIDILSGDGYLHKFSVVPDLTDFTVKLYDLSGVAKTGTLRWSAHGV